MNRLKTAVLIGAASLVLGVGTTAALALGRPLPGQPPSCTAPALPGAVVAVTFSDGGAMMGPGMHGGPMMRWPRMGMGMMALRASPAAVPAGQVSLLAVNRGGLAHEVVVLPLPDGASPGQRPVSADGEVDESGSLGEAARSCGAGGGEGIGPGATGWITLNLTPGRYELLCNIAGHYGSGMYTELDVAAAR